MNAIDIVVQSPRWAEAPAVEPALQRAIGAVLADCAVVDAEVSVMLADDATIRELNRVWLGRDKATNVLSFPTPEGPKGEGRFLGDIALAFETVLREAETDAKPFEHHVVHLAVHGLLHLLGYDHESDADADAMERQERMILAKLGIADPYATLETRRTEPA